MVKSFKEHLSEKKNVVKEMTVPTGAIQSPEDAELLGPTDQHGVPALFATIHWKSDQRPEGYTDDDVWQMNHDANAHLPELQAKMRAERDANNKKPFIRFPDVSQ